MNETFVTYSQAQALKRLGFDWSVYDGYARKIRLEPEPSLGEPKFIHCKIQKNYNDCRKGSSDGYEYCSAPTQSMAAKWLREVKGIHIILEPARKGGQILYVSYIVHKDFERLVNIPRTDYESALSAGLDKALELLEKGG